MNVPKRIARIRWVAAFCALGASGATAAAADSQAGASVLAELKAFRETGSVLMIAAHPDDENTQLLTYLARGRGYRTAYLSLTRGDGGQNLLGPEFGEELGLIRTEELLAARRVDSAQQFFTRALDFGFSKRADETMRIWDQQAITADIVRVIRTFRPDVVITRFNPDIPGGVGTHGHHTASAILARDAFNLLAKDPHAFPEQLREGLQPWVPRRLLLNAGGGGGGGAEGTTSLHVDISGTDSVLGVPFAAIAAQSRAQHKSQGFGQYGSGGARGGGPGGPRMESFTLLAGEPATTDIMDGIDSTWNRLDAGSAGGLGLGHQVATLASEAIDHFSPDDAAASVPAILEMKKILEESSVGNDPAVLFKRKELDHLLADCVGLTIVTQGPATATPGDTVHLTMSATVAAKVPVRWIAVRVLEGAGLPPMPAVDLQPAQPAARTFDVTIPANAPVSQPYWLREDPLPGLFRVSDARLIGVPENPPSLPVEYIFEIGGQTLTISDQPVQVFKNHNARRLEILAPVSLVFGSDVSLFAPGQSKAVTVVVTANSEGAAGTLRIEAPPGWKIYPPSLPLSLHRQSATVPAPLSFTVTAPVQPTPTPAILTAVASINGHDYSSGYKTIDYPHIPFLTLQPPAHLRATVLDLQCTAKNVAYLSGAGDSVAQCIEQMGCTVTQISGADLTADKLKSFDAVVLGVRALNVRTDIPSLQPLFDYASAGGTVIVQYNRPESLRFPEIAPFHVRLSASRVTDETAPVTFLAPNHRALNTPNKITPADFDNWIQERGIYYPVVWDPQFTPILSAGDPGEKPLTGGLLIADMPGGRGHFVCTSLVFFRQLPAGVPGAYRLMANLLSLGK